MPGKQEAPENMEARKRSYIFPSQVTSEPTGHEAAPEPIPVQPAAPSPAEKTHDPAILQEQETPERSKTRQGSYVFPSQPVAESTSPEAAPIPESTPQEPQMPPPSEPVRFQASWAGQRALKVEDSDPERPQRKMNWAIVGGIAVFAVVVVTLLASGLLHQNIVPVGSPAIETSVPGAGVSTYTAQNASTSSAPPASSSAPSVQTQQLTQEQQSMLDTLSQKFPEVVPELAKEITNDPLFLAAAAQAHFENPVFGTGGLEITLLLPDPRAGSLDKLGVEPYTPYSDAQAYIRDNYVKLRGMEAIADWVEYPVTLFYQNGIGGEKTLDWSLMSVFWGLHEYSQSFTPYAEQYMADKGFHTAAIELLMPDIGGAGQNSAHLQEYFADLAAALEFKGVNVNGQTVVDRGKIEQILKTRFMEAWVCDSVAIVNHDNYRPYTPYIRVRSLAPVTFFGRVYEGLDAKYKSGALTPPSSLAEFETLYMAAIKEMSEGVLDSTAAKNQELIMDYEYAFDWETLGDEGISACPELVEEIRGFLSSYDFDLMFTSHLFGY